MHNRLAYFACFAKKTTLELPCPPAFHHILQVFLYLMGFALSFVQFCFCLPFIPIEIVFLGILNFSDAASFVIPFSIIQMALCFCI